MQQKFYNAAGITHRYFRSVMNACNCGVVWLCCLCISPTPAAKSGRSFYLDTAIWRDYFEDRKDGIRPLGEFAFQFLKKCQYRSGLYL